MSTEILTLSPLQPDVQADLEAQFTVHRFDQADDPQALLRDVGARVKGLLAGGGDTVDEDLLAQLPALEVVSCASAGYEGFDTAALARRGIRMGNTSAALDDDVADTAILLAMAARRDLVRGHLHVTSGDWAQGDMPLQRSFSGGRLGIVGMGQIGQAVAQRAASFGKEIGYTARSPKDSPARYFEDVTALADWSDTLVVCLPGGAATRNMIDAPVLKALGAQGVFVNVGRGSVVDETALIAALQDGTLGAAGLDVFEDEPTPDGTLVALPNVTCFPHHASGTVEARTNMARMARDTLTAYFTGAALPCEITLR